MDESLTDFDLISRIASAEVRQVFIINNKSSSYVVHAVLEDFFFPIRERDETTNQATEFSPGLAQLDPGNRS